MAISLAELTNLLEDLGALLRLAENEAAAVATLETAVDAIEAVYVANGHESLIANLHTIYDSRISSAESSVGRVYEAAKKLLSHRDYVLEQASLGDSPNEEMILQTFFDLLQLNAQTIQQNVVTISAVTMDCANADCGRLVLDKELDGVSVPIRDGFASPRLLGLDSELSFSDDFVAECTVSEPRSGTSFQVRGTKAPSGRRSVFGATGYGDGPSISLLDYSDSLRNGRFETFANNAPTGWTVTTTGVAGTNYAQETGTANIWTGANSLKLLGDAAITSFRFHQTLSSLKAGQRYGLAAWVKGNVGITAGDLKIRATWDGAALGAGEFLDIPLATLNNSDDFVLHTAFVTIPLNLPANPVFEILFDGTPSAHAIYVSDVAFGPVPYWNGICGFLKEGKGRFSQGDTAAFSTANNEAGKFQTFLRDFFRFQWPSSDTPTIADTLIS